MDGLIDAAAAPVWLAVAGWAAVGVIGVVTAFSLGGHVSKPGRRGEGGDQVGGARDMSGDPLHASKQTSEKV